MRKRLAVFSTICVLVLTVAGCDSFSLLNQFAASGSAKLSLSLQKSSLQQGDTIDLYPSGGKPPYSFGLIQGDLADSGTLGSVSNQTYTAGTAIGTVDIRLTDASGNHVDATATIIPPTPTSFQAVGSTTTTKQITLSWDYSDPTLISGFQITRSQDGVTFTNLATVGSSSSNSYTYPDQGLNQNQTYYYQVYALASTGGGATYQSLPSAIASATP